MVRDVRWTGGAWEATDDAGQGTGLLQVAEEHLLLVEHLGGLVLRLLRVDEDGPEEVRRAVPHPQLLHPVERTDGWRQM